MPTVRASDGETDGVEWLRHQLPGDLDWPGMSFVVARAAAGDCQAVAIVTWRESPDPLADAVRLTRKTLAEPAGNLIAEHEAVWDSFWSAGGIDVRTSSCAMCSTGVSTSSVVSGNRAYKQPGYSPD